MALEEYRLDMQQCCRCSCCKFIPMLAISGYKYVSVCPSIEKFNFHCYSAGGKLNIGVAMLEGRINYSKILEHVVYNCQLCGGCAVSCNFGMDMYVLEPIIEMRIRLVSEGHMPAVFKEMLQRFKTHGTIVAVTDHRGRWAQGLGVKNAFKEPIEVYFHTGCLMNFDAYFQDLARKAVTLLKMAELEVGIGYEEEFCCGSKIYQMGAEEVFIAVARKYSEKLNRAKIRTIVTACAHCYWALKVLYRKYDLNGGWRVFHISEMLEKLLTEGRLKVTRSNDLVVTYHDPCRLGRLGEPWSHWKGEKVPGPRFVFRPPRPYRRGTHGVYDPPRNVLAKIPGVRLEEMPRRKEFSWCCGAGGAVDIYNPEFALWTATERLKEAESTGAKTIVTACPWCHKLLSEATRQKQIRLAIKDLVDILFEAIV